MEAQTASMQIYLYKNVFLVLLGRDKNIHEADVGKSIVP